MLVHKTVEVSVGNGSPAAIAEAVSKANLPDHASCVRVERDMAVDFMLDTAKLFTDGVILVFQWTDEE